MTTSPKHTSNSTAQTSKEKTDHLKFVDSDELQSRLVSISKMIDFHLVEVGEQLRKIGLLRQEIQVIIETLKLRGIDLEKGVEKP